METEVIAQQGDTLDYLIFRTRGLVTDALLEAAYALNPDIGDYGVTLPAGLTVKVPALPAVSVEPTVKLYD